MQIDDPIEQLMKQIHPTVMSGRFPGGGNAAFRLYCSRTPCYSKASISVRRRDLSDEQKLRKAAESFAKLGWHIVGRLPVCPECRETA
jgi:hypothetical protein